MYSLKIENLAKRFGPRKVFADINFELQTGGSIAIVGPNGSGKSTLVKVILGLLRPTLGTVGFSLDGKNMTESETRSRTSFVAPYLSLYDHLSGEENLKFFSAVAGDHVTGKEINALLARVGLEGRGTDYLADYSSGMKQRLKYAVALLNKPDFLFLDEPTSNLDEEGKGMVSQLVEQYRKQSMVVLATNEPQEYGFAEQICRLGG
ncbi:MAG: ABC transporter ATP-binding protein [Candidatus Zixiibacteriota bacterium]|nr:MAG: ABC transporter ATP-binding protein [candidate division Zixibacteria bacterium]